MEDLNKFINSDRRDFMQSGLNEADLPPAPAILFDHWLRQAIERNNPEPYAFVLMSASASDYPSGRVVYLRALEEDGQLVFFTNYNSEKGRQIAETGKVSALFFWPMNERQVRIKGEVQKAPADLSDAYFAGRPRESQIGAWASHQSEVIASRAEMDKRFEAIEERFSGEDEIPRPDFWGGYIISPVEYEFWEGRKSRLHDRIVYEKSKAKNWNIKRLSP